MTPDWSELELDPTLIKALLEQDLAKPTRIQQQVVPAALDEKDILATSPTGTGKTLAFLLSAFQFLIDFPRNKPGGARVLILTPTRELAEQIGVQAEKLAAQTGHNCLVVTGGVNYGSHLSELQKNIDILIATPGRLIDYLNEEHFEAEDVSLLILDEADRMLDMGFKAAVQRIIDEARHIQQRMLFSATTDASTLSAFSKLTLEQPVVIEANPPKRERGKIVQYMYIADNAEHKQALLFALLKEYDGKVLVFVKKRERTHELAEWLGQQGIPSELLEGELPQAERQKRLARFSSNRVRIMIATDVASRGIDIPDVQLVVNFDLPRKGDIYLHRIGRTGRAGKKGIAISLVEAHDAENLGRIERYQELRIEKRVIESLRPQFKFPDPHKKRASKKKKKTKKK